jgi:hypothetical protein
MIFPGLLSCLQLLLRFWHVPKQGREPSFFGVLSGMADSNAAGSCQLLSYVNSSVENYPARTSSSRYRIASYPSIHTIYIAA